MYTNVNAHASALIKLKAGQEAHRNGGCMRDLGQTAAAPLSAWMGISWAQFSVPTNDCRCITVLHYSTKGRLALSTLTTVQYCDYNKTIIWF